MEGAPANLDVSALSADLLANVPSVAEVHHVHAWSVTQEEVMVTLHVRCGGCPYVVVKVISGRGGL